MVRLIEGYRSVVGWVSGRWGEGVALLATRIALGGVFWRSGRTKVVEGTWLEVSDTTRYLFSEEYAKVPLPADLAATMATYAEFALPILLILGFGTRFAALGLLGMTMTIQLFVYPDAWWTVHSLWTAMALVLIVRGGGVFAVDAITGRWLPAGAPRAVVA